MLRAKILLLIFLLQFGKIDHAQADEACPTRQSLHDGLVYTYLSGGGAQYVNYRLLDGPYVGRHLRSSRKSSGSTISISYAGLFTYKYWQDGKLVQYEEPQSDMSEFLRFEPGSKHQFKSIRYAYRKTTQEWRTDLSYEILEAEDIKLGDCTYETVLLQSEGTVIYPDGTVHEVQGKFRYLPDLMIRISGIGYKVEDVSDVRHRRLRDGWRWPFNSDYKTVLEK